jgi:cytohesin
MTQSKVDINVKDEAESTPLHWAVKGGSLDIVRTIIGKGADIAGVAERPGTAIYYDGAGTVTWQTRRIETIDGTPLHWAAHTGRADIAEFLISKGADVNATTAYRWTPIYFAAREQHEDLVELLMARGAVVNMNDDTFGSPMHAAGSRRIAELLQNSGASTNAKCTYYGSPLHMAAYEGRAEVVQFLLEKGLNVDELARWQLDVTDITAPVTPPYVAALGGQLEVVKLLMAKGADVNFVSAKLVIRNTSTGKDEEADFGCGGGVLHAAAWGGHVGVCEYLLHKGAQIDQKGDMPSGTPFSLPRRKVTPLSVAAQRGHLSVVKLLLEKGASANAKDESGHTAYYWAASDEIKDVLRKHGAKSDKPQQGRKGAS